jgi:hypothetical protein
LTGDSLAAAARQRAVMSTIADTIVAAAAGKSLRVAVGCADSDRTGFADHLTRALHARGRPCRYVTTRPAGMSAAPTVTVITGGTPGADETDLCRIDIQLRVPVPDSACAGRPDVTAAEPQAKHTTGDDKQPEIVVDYCHPDGLTICHIVPALSPLPRPRQGQHDDDAAKG